MVQTRDWTQLPPELLYEIAVHLTVVPDHISLRSVCSPWRSAAKSFATNLPPQSPWLLLPSDVEHLESKTRRHVFSLSEARTYKIPLPDPLNTRIFASPDGRLIILGKCIGNHRPLSFLNPITRRSIPLPRLCVSKRTWSFAHVIVRNIKLFGSDLLVAVCLGGDSIRFCHAHDAEWKKVPTGPNDIFGDFVYHNGLLFVLHRQTATTWVVDLQKLEVVYTFPLVPRARNYRNYLVKSSAGDLLLVLRCQRKQRKRYKLFKLSATAQKQEWIDVSGIGDDVLFIDYANAMCFAASRVEGCRGNCIYFLDKIDRDYGYGLLSFDIGTNQVTRTRSFPNASRKLFLWSRWIVPNATL